MPRSIRRLTPIIVLSALAVAALGAAGADDAQRAMVRSVVDGDTIRVDIGGRAMTVRLIGIDTPELRDRRNPSVAPQAFAREATEFTRRALKGQHVRLEFEPTERLDKYGRTLAYVFLDDGTFLNRELVRLGLAHLYTQSAFRYRKQFRADEEEARRERRGLWSVAAVPRAGVVIGNRVSGIYHLRGQMHYHDVAEHNRVYFDSEAAARAAGFEPARR